MFLRSYTLPGFYSILVRLKAHQKPVNNSPKKLGFYSILVRLKVEELTEEVEALVSFYSILVRLKEIAKYVSKDMYREFLFHTGSIKRCSKSSPNARVAVSIPYWFD